MSSACPDLMAMDGRRLGVRAQATRRRLLDATAELLETNGIVDLKVVDVARKVGTSPATFYQYFANVEEAVLALAEEAGEKILALVPLVDQPWKSARALDLARQLVDGYTKHWDADRAVLRTRDLNAQEGDSRFRAVRNQSLAHLTDRLAERIAENQETGRVSSEFSAHAAASALVSMMGRATTYHDQFDAKGVSRAAMLETVARILYQTVTGRRS